MPRTTFNNISIKWPQIEGDANMRKTDEALQMPEKEYKELLPETSNVSNMPAVAIGPKHFPLQASLGRYQEVKTRLINRFPQESIKTILITGTADGDGASTTAINFATSLAQDCRLNILLLDANLRRPHLHEVFGIDYHPCLTSLLTQKETQASFFDKEGHGNLYVLPGGEKQSSALTLFESTRFDNFLKSARKKFDYVILDAAPVTSFSEPQVLGPKVDGVILVIAAGKTRRQVAIRAKKELEDAGAKILGVVLNKRKHYIPNWIYKRL